MVVEHAERFGLSQLHQLRGRVGRGAHASTCVLLYQYPLSEAGRARLDALVETTDGFVIAERDLEQRGPGDFFGTRQSGLPTLRVGDLHARPRADGGRAPRSGGVARPNRRAASLVELPVAQLGRAVRPGRSRVAPMRIIAGTLKGRRLSAPPGPTVRPTSDRLRETLFNVLGPTVDGARVLDGFAGTGAIGLEALVRGARHVTFVERDRARAARADGRTSAPAASADACAIIRDDFLTCARDAGAHVRPRLARSARTTIDDLEAVVARGAGWLAPSRDGWCSSTAAGASHPNGAGRPIAVRAC